MIDFNNDYPDRISIYEKKIFADGKVIHANKGRSLTYFYVIILMELLVIYVTVFHLFPLVTDDNYTFYILFVTVACYLSHFWCVLLIDAVFVNQSFIDYEKREILIINIFGRKRVYHVQDITNLEFYYRMFFWNRAFFYKIILKNENKKFVIMSFFKYKYEVKKICEFLNNFKNFDLRE